MSLSTSPPSGSSNCTSSDHSLRSLKHSCSYGQSEPSELSQLQLCILPRDRAPRCPHTWQAGFSLLSSTPAPIVCLLHSLQHPLDPRQFLACLPACLTSPTPGITSLCSHHDPLLYLKVFWAPLLDGLLPRRRQSPCYLQGMLQVSVPCWSWDHSSSPVWELV